MSAEIKLTCQIKSSFLILYQIIFKSIKYNEIFQMQIIKTVFFLKAMLKRNLVYRGVK